MKTKRFTGTLPRFINKAYYTLLSEKRKEQFEQVIYFTAIGGFILHMLLIAYLQIDFKVHTLTNPTDILPNLLFTIYTPFTIILLYEIYLLIFYLPHSITTYLGKQYEIVALIMVRGIFDNLAKLPVGTTDFDFDDLIPLLIAFGGLLVLLLFILIFYKLSDDKIQKKQQAFYSSSKYYNYILLKRVLALGLLFFFLYLFMESLFRFGQHELLHIKNLTYIMKEINIVFFNSFFTALILTEVFLLLFLYKLSGSFNKMMRNSGFILSTVLLKLSFRTTGLTFLIIILIAVIFGVATMGIYKLYEKKLPE